MKKIQIKWAWSEIWNKYWLNSNNQNFINTPVQAFGIHLDTHMNTQEDLIQMEYIRNYKEHYDNHLHLLILIKK